MGTTNCCHCVNCPLQYTDQCVVWTKLTAALEREKVLEEALEQYAKMADRCEAEYASCLSIGTVMAQGAIEAISRVKAMREGK